LPELSPTKVALPREKRTLSIRFYAVALVLIAALPLTGAAGLSALQAIQRTEDQATEQLRLTAIDSATEVKRWLNGRKRLLDVISDQLVADPGQCDAVLSQVFRLNSEYTAFVLINPDGETICRFTSIPLPPFSPEMMLKRTIVQSVIQTNAFVAGSVEQGPTTLEWLLVSGQPVFAQVGVLSPIYFSLKN
jgi:hypothetical protein